MRFELSLVDRVAARVRMPLVAVGLVLMVVTLVAGRFTGSPVWLGRAALAVFLLGLVLYVRLGTPNGEVIDIGSPVTGRWRALNSPTSRVPSHHVHGWSQTYAIDLIYDPAEESGRRSGGGRSRVARTSSRGSANPSSRRWTGPWSRRPQPLGTTGPEPLRSPWPTWSWRECVN